MLVDKLKELGFNENKAKIYMACLESGTATAAEISRRAGIVRTTVYKILEELAEENLVEINIDKKIKTFTALAPAKLVELLEGKKNSAASLLPDLLDIFKQTKFKPKVKFFEGVDGLKKVFEDTLQFKDITVYTFSPISDLLSAWGDVYIRHFLNRRVKNNIIRRNLRQKSDASSAAGDWEFYAADEKLKREVRFLPTEIKFNVLIQLYENRLSIISTEENYGFIIESRELFLFMKQIFELLWLKSDWK